jgi:hypothetical protein
MVRSQDEQFRLAGALRRMMNRTLSMAWYEDMTEQRRKLDQALRRMMHRKLSMGWLSTIDQFTKG